ncbi:hypothetical protein [Oceanicoccus sp. KOV_DT_Chl]|uniref:hypothetical protein n=1 Tax=Oceanicoccus sp. KOV_DT_Chl TaxID=1904639 RepID=UPI000C7DF921|nr:hypothetical protein [Oceanicoccus sp. KOV_DT_Chl]
MMLARVYIAVGLLLGVAACATEPANLTACTEPRPQVCPMHYVPVCATLNDQQQKTYSNDCSACSDVTVVAYQANACAPQASDDGAAKTRF